MATHVVSVIDVGDFGAEALRVGDLSGDGAPDLLLTQSLYGTRRITCLTAVSITGEILWEQGSPSRDNGYVYSDLPVQIHDWDGDGRIVDTFTVQYSEIVAPADRDAGYYALAADVWGDSRDEAVFAGSRGVCVYANACPLAIHTPYNETIYTGV